MQIEVEVKGQRIKRLNSPGSVEDTLNYLTCHFVFEGEEWDNTVKTAYFRNPASGKTYSQILAEDNTCTVPWEALTDKGFVNFSALEDYYTFGGIRIEDDILVTEDGARRLGSRRLPVTSSEIEDIMSQE